ncbi:TolC family outer membrane protein [Amaricoccus tamworthensis]|uniref:TolC family outer membrane protein n=1 Tax=Amaricoccus tamworthensis TaxID=57002 RepID=UPI003C7BFBEF
MKTARIRNLLLTTGAVALLSLQPVAGFAESLTDALIKAYQTSPVLASGRAGLRSLDESVPIARSTKRPQVDANIGAGTSADYGDFDDSRSDYLQATLDASLIVFDSGQTQAAIESARNDVAAGRADLKGIEQTVLYDAVQAYVDVRRDEEFVKLARADVDRLEETLRATRNRFEVGEVTRTDVSQSEARLAESRATLAVTSGQLQISREAYRAAIGNAPNNLENLPPKPDLPATLSEAEAVAMQNNPDLISAQFSERVAVYDFDRALAAKRPTVQVGASTGLSRSTNSLGSFGGDPFAELSVSGNMPLYTGGRNDSLIRQAQALIDQRRFQVQETGRLVRENVAAAWAQYEAAGVTIIATREQAEASRIAAEGVAEEARLGARSTLEVLDADQDRLEAEAQIVEAIRTEYLAAYALLQAMGLLTVEHLNLGIETYDPDINFARVQDGPIGGYDTSVVDRIRSRWEQ